MNNQLLDDAIADAKAVRATAILNARRSLEEAFSGKFAEMFDEKMGGKQKLPDRNLTIHILKD